MTPVDFATIDDVADLVRWYASPPRGVRANMIFSVDGAASFAGRAGPLSNPLDQALLVALRGYADVVLVGAGTVRAESYGPVRLPAAQRTWRSRHWHTDTPPPVAVVTRSGELPASLFTDPSQPPIIVTSADAAADRQFHAGSAAEVIVAGDSTVDIAQVVHALDARGLTHILCEGGPTLLDELVLHDLVDEMCVTISPTLAGTGGAVSAAGSVRQRAELTALSLQHVLSHDGYLFLKYGR